MTVWRFIATGLAVSVIALSGCQREQEEDPTPFTASSLPLSVIGADQKGLLKDTFESLLPYRPNQPADTLVILPDANRANADLAQQAHDAVKSGHRVLLFGDSPFGPLYPWRTGLWKQPMNPSQWTPGSVLESISDIPLWNAYTNENQILSTIRHIRTNRVACSLFQLEFKEVDQSAWISASLDAEPSEAIPSIEFLSRSTMQGQPFILRVEDTEENEFYCVVPVDEDWQLFKLTPDAFHSREGTHGLKDFNQVRTWSIGYDQQQLRFPVGRQSLEISTLFRGPGPLPRTSDFPEFPFVGGGQTYTGQVIHFRKEDSPDWQFTHPPIGIRAPYPNPATGAPPLLRELIYGHTPDGQRIPAATQIRYPERTVGSWIWVGMNLAEMDQQVLVELVETIYRSSHRPALLQAAYPNQFTFDPLAPIHITVQARGFDYVPFKYRIQTQLETITGRPVSQTSTQPFDLNPSTGMLEMKLKLDGIAPMAAAQTDYQVKVMLQNQGATQRTHDEIIIPVKVLPKTPEIDRRLFLRPAANLFRIGRNSIQFYGITYTPGQRIAADEDWLSPERFPSEIIRADLARLSKAGMNSLRIPCPSFEYPEQLRFLLQEIYRQGFLVVLKLPPLPPDIDPSTLAEFFNTSEVSDSPQVVALELDTGFLEYPEFALEIRQSWRAWLAEQFGSIQTAAEILGKAIAATPSAHQLRHPKEFSHPTLLRAFQNDWAGRRIGYHARLLRAAGVHQMITAPVALDLHGQPEGHVSSGFDVRAVAPHVDYLSLSAAFGYGTQRQVLQGTALSLLARGLAGGKPLVWQHIGSGLPLPASFRMKGHQKDMHTWGLELARLSQAAGAFGDQYTDYRNVETNHGLWISPIQSQPALSCYTDHGGLLRNRRPTPRPWKGKRFSMDSRGGSLLDAWREQLSTDPKDPPSLAPELRTDAFRKLTAKMNIDPIVNGASGPLRSVNAEWSWIETPGNRDPREPGKKMVFEGREPIQLHLLNTGNPTWSASVKDQINTVWVEIRHEELQPRYLAVPETGFGEIAELEWHPHGYGTFTLRPVLWATGGFGEALEMYIQLTDGQFDHPRSRQQPPGS